MSPGELIALLAGLAVVLAVVFIAAWIIDARRNREVEHDAERIQPDAHDEEVP